MPIPIQKQPAHLKMEVLEKADSIWTTDKVLLVGLDGVLSARADRGGLFTGPSALVAIKDVLDCAEHDDSIRTVLLRIDSPGGSVTASDLIYTELKRFKGKTGKKIIAICMGVAASGGYYAAMAADKVYVLPTTVTGSIGVIGIFPNLQGLSSKIGVDVHVVKSGAMKDMGSMWRPFTDDERKVFQDMIDTLYNRFLEVVAQGRPNLDKETIRNLADGRVYTARQAVDLGLADGIAYLPDAFDAAKNIAGLRDAALVAYVEPDEYKGHYYALANGAATTAKSSPTPETPSQVNLLNIQLGPAQSVLEEGPFHYLWLP